jgi:hypothetical protein
MACNKQQQLSVSTPDQYARPLLAAVEHGHVSW